MALVPNEQGPPWYREVDEPACGETVLRNAEGELLAGAPLRGVAGHPARRAAGAGGAAVSGTCTHCGGPAWRAGSGWWHWGRNCRHETATFTADPDTPAWEAAWKDYR
jgi:hypothetical protein